MIRTILTLTLITFLSLSCQENKKEIYKDSSYPIEERVDDLLSRMTLEEKVSQMRMFHANLGIELGENGEMELTEDVKQRLVNGIGGIKNPGEFNSPVDAARLNTSLQKYIMENNRLGIPAFFVTESYNGVDAEGCTRFGRPIAMAASFNTDLVTKVYDVIGREARMRGLHLTHSPEADIVRDPRFGRMSETFGEDTYLTTEMIVSAINGLQGDYTGISKTHIGAVTKHFAGYGQISGGRNFASVEISPRTLIDEIFPPFEAAVKRSKTLGIMASHGDINGVASHSNPWLLREVLRDKWGFDGYTVSDANDIGRLHYFMKVAETPEDAVILALKAGMDLDLYADDAYVLLPKIVKDKPELMHYIDKSTKNVLRTKFRLGLFENPYADIENSAKLVRNEASLNLAHQADLESIILLKNNNSTLPLKNVKNKTVALVGPLLTPATKPWFQKEFGQEVSFIEEKGYNLTNEHKAVPQLTHDDEKWRGINKIVKQTTKADYIIVFVGGDEFTAKEAFFNGAVGDRDDIDPVGMQDELIEELKKTGKPLIVVLKHRRTLSINTIAEKADAIIDSWELSEIGDHAIAKIISGSAVPSGKLPVTVPRTIGQLPFHYSCKEIDFKKGYLFSDLTPLYPFGFGLSYSEFNYSNLSLNKSELPMNSTLLASVDVTNTGDYVAKEVVQFYLKDVIGSVLRPNKELKYFEKIELNPGETKTVSFTIEPGMLEFTGLEMTKVIEPGKITVLAGGNSRDLLEQSFELVE